MSRWAIVFGELSLGEVYVRVSFSVLYLSLNSQPVCYGYRGDEPFLGNRNDEGDVRTLFKSIRHRSPLTPSGRQLSTTECQELCTFSVTFILGPLAVYMPHLDWAYNLVYESRHASGDGQVKSGDERLLVRVIVPIGVAWPDAFVLSPLRGGVCPPLSFCLECPWLCCAIRRGTLRTHGSVTTSPRLVRDRIE